ncbi:SRPBCC family protein [Cystobacter fuscus]|uniref:SRPBCC family protein n=1 Tax=Cystobacter fuscus TaxID=43 RepID=UPI0037BE7780
MLKRISLALGVAVVGFAALVTSRPSTYRTERAMPLAAPAEIPFALVNDLHRWRLWSPWDALDPGMRRHFDGPIAGPEAVYTWAGNARAGKGRMTVLESRPYDFIRVRFERLAPRPSTSTLDFTFQPTAEGVLLRWSQEGQLSWMDKARSLFTDLEARRGEELDQGLKALAAVSETEVKNRRERDELIKARSEEKARQAPPTP